VSDRATLLRAARLSAAGDVKAALARLAHTVALLAAKAPPGLFIEHLDRLDLLMHASKTAAPETWMAAHVHGVQFTARSHGLNDTLDRELAAVAAADEALHACEMTSVRFQKYTVGVSGEVAATGAFKIDVLELAARIRLGVAHGSPLLETVTVEQVAAIDNTAVERLAEVAQCSPVLIGALAHLSVVEALAAARAASS
jgi:hypothetical protein